MHEIKPGVWKRALVMAVGAAVFAPLVEVGPFALAFACLAMLALAAPHLVSDADLSTVAWWALSIAAIRLPITCAVLVEALWRQLLGYLLFGRVPRVKPVRRHVLNWRIFGWAETLAAVAIVLAIHLPWRWQTVGVIALVTAVTELAGWLILRPTNRKRHTPQHAAAADVLDRSVNDRVQ